MVREILSQSVGVFIDNYVESFLSWDVILLFSHNPDLRGSVGKIADFLGRKPEDLGKVLEELVKKGLVKSRKKGKSKVYFYEPTPKLASQVSDFVKALESREKRLAILAMILEKSH